MSWCACLCLHVQPCECWDAAGADSHFSFIKKSSREIVCEGVKCQKVIVFEYKEGLLITGSSP